MEATMSEASEPPWKQPATLGAHMKNKLTLADHRRAGQQELFVLRSTDPRVDAKRAEKRRKRRKPRAGVYQP